MFVVAIDQATDAQRQAVQRIVTTHAEQWWHRMSDLWIAEGFDVFYWRDLIRAVLPPPASVLVLELPQPALRSWACAGMQEDGLDWMYEIFGAALPKPADRLPDKPSLEQPPS
ncbi:MAG: hypothetical protein WBC33_04045 [Conexibacter sp.]